MSGGKEAERFLEVGSHRAKGPAQISSLFPGIIVRGVSEVDHHRVDGRRTADDFAHWPNDLSVTEFWEGNTFLSPRVMFSQVHPWEGWIEKKARITRSGFEEQYASR